MAPSLHLKKTGGAAAAAMLTTPVPMAPLTHQRLVAVGGGTGLPAVLEGLCDSAASDTRPSDLITAVVTMTDDGGSSGRLREVFGVLPPGDVRNCVAAAAGMDSPFGQLLQHRFSDGGEFGGHSIGNLVLTALTQMTGSFPAAVEQLSGMMALRASVLPSTPQDVHLVAEMESGRVVIGETAIVQAGERIHRLSLRPNARPLPEVLRAIVNADGIVIGPGSLYSSVLPNLLVEGVAATISGVRAVRIYVANLMTEPGETDNYSLDDHLRAIREHVGFDLFDYVLVNRKPVAGAVASRYAWHGSRPVPREVSLKHAGGATVVAWDLTVSHLTGKIRHDPRPLAAAIRTIVSWGRQPARGMTANQG